MDAVTIDPHQLADALGVDLLTLAETMRVWAADAMSSTERGIREDVNADGDDLARFDEGMARARLHVEAFVAVEKVWREKNPDAFTEDE